jgi:RNA polymerase sigma-70 factor (ECF subfamily)
MGRVSAEDLFLRHHLTIFRFLRKMTGDVALAEDVTQDLFVRVIRGVESFDSREQDLAWLFRIARRLLADHARNQRRRPISVPGSPADPSPVAAVQPLALVLDEALGLLPEPEREAFVLREQSGLGYDEIAAISGATPGAVRNRIHRARCQLRQFLETKRRLGERSAPKEIIR